MKERMAAVVLALALGACVATTPRIEEARLREVRAGTTSYTEIVKRFGTPSLVSKNPDGTSFATYIHADPAAKDGGAVVPLVAGVARDSVTFHFDTQGLLKDIRATSRSGLVARMSPATTAAEAAAPTGAAPAAPSPTGSSASPAAEPTGASSSRGWIWRLPDWLPGTPRENR